MVKDEWESFSEQLRVLGCLVSDPLTLINDKEGQLSLEAPQSESDDGKAPCCVGDLLQTYI